MASLEQRGRRYRIVFRLGGRKHSAAVKTADRREAEAYLARLEENLRLAERGRLTIPDGADVGLFLLSDGKLVQRVSVAPVLTLADLIAGYHATFTAGVKEKNTAKTERIHLAHVERVVGGTTPVSQVTAAALQGYIDARCRAESNGRPINPVTVKKELATVRYVWNWAFRQQRVGVRFPGTGLVFPKAKSKPPFRTLAQIRAIVDRGGLTQPELRAVWDGLYLTPAEITEFLAHVRRQPLRAWVYPFVVCATFTGARRSELLRARIEDFDWANRVVVLREKKRSKERETFRTVEMTAFTERVMREYLGASHPGGLFAFVEVANVPLSCSVSQKTFRRAVRGSPWQMARGYHLLRHSFISALAAVGVDQRVIDEMTGHTTAEMQKRYRHLTPQTQRAALQTAFGQEG
jgi:integrase